MPITICSSSKATPAKGIEYILDPEKVIARGSQGFMSDDPTKMAKQMRQTMHLFGKGYGYDERKYYHAKVSFHPADRPENGGRLTARYANKYAAEYAAKVWPGREVVWAVQDHGSSIHIHFIVAACHQTTGKKLNARNAEYRNWKDYANTLASEYGLSVLDWRKATREKREREKNPEEAVSSTFAEKDMRNRHKAVWKDELRDIIDHAAAECRSIQEFRSALKIKGVVLSRLTEQTISYKLHDHKACRGDTLGGDYTLSAIRNALMRNARSCGHPQFDEIGSESRNKYRSWGRMAGMKREEVDTLCDRLTKATRQEIQALWEEYLRARDVFWADYHSRTNSIRRELDEAYQLRRRAKDAEWILNPSNRRASIGSIIFAGIFLHQHGGSTQFDAYIDNLKQRQETLRKEAQQFKKYSNDALTTLKTKNLSLEEYTDSLLAMQQIAEDVYFAGPGALEYWAKKYQAKLNRSFSSAQALDDLFADAKRRAQPTGRLYEFLPADLSELG